MRVCLALERINITILFLLFPPFNLKMFEKLVVVDCRGHLMGRLASILAKELLNGQKVVCEYVNN